MLKCNVEGSSYDKHDSQIFLKCDDDDIFCKPDLGHHALESQISSSGKSVHPSCHIIKSWKASY